MFLYQYSILYSPFPPLNIFLCISSHPQKKSPTLVHVFFFFTVSLLSLESSSQVILMTLPKALFDPGWQLCQAQIIWALYYLGSFPLGWQKPFISLGLVVVCKPALFSQVVIKKDEQDRDFTVYGKTSLCTRRGVTGSGLIQKLLVFQV